MARARKDYLAIAAERVIRPADMPPNFSFLIYGRNKRGKTTFSLSGGIDETLLVDPENGSGLMIESNPFVWPIARWADFDEVWGALRTGKLSPNHIKQGESSTPFRFVSLDGLTKINNVCLKHVMKVQEDRDLDRQPGFVQQRDYGKSGELMKEMFAKFHNLKMIKIYTCQERMISGTESWMGDEEDEAEAADITWVPDLPKGVRADIEGLVDVIGRIYTKKVEVKGKPKLQRRLQIGIDDGLDTGYRSDFNLPDMIRYPSVKKLMKLMSEGKLK